MGRVDYRAVDGIFPLSWRAFKNYFETSSLSLDTLASGLSPANLLALKPLVLVKICTASFNVNLFLRLTSGSSYKRKNAHCKRRIISAMHIIQSLPFLSNSLSFTSSTRLVLRFLLSAYVHSLARARATLH